MFKFASTAAAAMLFAGLAGSAGAAELVAGGDFESGLGAFGVTGNTHTNTAAAYGPCCGVTGSEPSLSSNHFVAFGDGNTSGLNALSQTFATVVGQMYSLTFNAGAFGGGTNLLNVSAGGVSNSYTVTANNNADTTFGSYGFSFVGTGADKVTFAVTTVADNTDAILDNVSVTGPAVAGVPEPASWAMMILGFGSAGVVLRRRRTLVTA
ncbi:PEPxxWA-CTERM sorting domain-containing protein [Phenylobacterium sp.]|uniref:PEPxxWA-CTERM sorting domain-containing protein n=1 Tax=Phenylobacterium sp. TaxID=1871053 RepID=UPI0025FA2DB6|nr:PEPxxWA-CTERM sorting domain-containing protein [Phenylobacterium sp.]